MKGQPGSSSLKVYRIGRLRIFCFMLGLLVMPASWSYAGMVVEERLELVGMSAITGEELDTFPPQEVTNYYQGKKVRTETEKTTFILDFDRSMMIFVNSEKKSYKELNLKKIREFQDKAKQLSTQLQKRLEAQLETIPPEQKEVMRKQLDALSSKAARSEQESKVTIKATGKEKKINGYPCKEYEMFKDEKKEAIYWLASSVSSKALDVYQKEINKMAKGMGPFSGLYYQAWEHIGGKGFPIKIKNLNTKKGSLAFDREVLHVEETTLPESHFLPPEEYKRVEIFASPKVDPSGKKPPGVSTPQSGQADKKSIQNSNN